CKRAYSSESKNRNLSLLQLCFYMSGRRHGELPNRGAAQAPIRHQRKHPIAAWLRHNSCSTPLKIGTFLEASTRSAQPGHDRPECPVSMPSPYTTSLQARKG